MYTEVIFWLFIYEYTVFRTASSALGYWGFFVFSSFSIVKMWQCACVCSNKLKWMHTYGDGDVWMCVCKCTITIAAHCKNTCAIWRKPFQWDIPFNSCQSTVVYWRTQAAFIHCVSMYLYPYEHFHSVCVWLP